MSSFEVDIDQNVTDAFDVMRTSRKTGHALVAGIDNQTHHLTLIADYPEGTTLSEIQKQCPQFEPRLAIFLAERVHRDGRKSYPLIIISYCPPGLAAATNILFTHARTHLQDITQIQTVWNVKKRRNINDEKLAECFDTNKW